MFKILILGERGAGKTSFMYRLVYNEFDKTVKPTTSYTLFPYKILNADNREIEVNFHDISEKVDMFSKNADGALIIIHSAKDKHDIRTQLNFYFETLIKSANDNIPIIISLSHSDIENIKSAVEDLEQLFKEDLFKRYKQCFQHIKITQHSALTGENIIESGQLIAHQSYHHARERLSAPTDNKFHKIEHKELVSKTNKSEIFKATYGGKIVALKYLENDSFQETQKNFQHEIQIFDILKKINSPYIIGYYKQGIDGGRQYIMMQFGYFGCLAISNNFETATPVERMGYCIDTVKGLACLHKHNILHRDMKTENLLVDIDYRVRITDFDLSVVLEENQEFYKSTTLVGTQRFIPPELWQLKLDHTQKTNLNQAYIYNKKGDIYSTGLVLWEILLKEKSRVSPVDVCKGHRPVKPQQNHREMPEMTSELIKWCWQQQSSKRPNTNQILEQLEQDYQTLQEEALKKAQEYDSDHSYELSK